MILKPVSIVFVVIFMLWIPSQIRKPCGIPSSGELSGNVQSINSQSIHTGVNEMWNAYRGVPNIVDPFTYIEIHAGHKLSHLWKFLFRLINSVGFKPNATQFNYSFLPAQLLSRKRDIIKHPGKKAVAYICLILLMQSGDCETNPGPSSVNDSCSKFPCLICNKPCTWAQKSVQCDECEGWYHTHCMGVNTIVYEALGHSNASWTCCGCGLPNFSTSLFSDWSINLSNSYSSIDTLGSDDSPLSPPVATSSPKPQNHTAKNKPKTRRAKHTLKVLVINFQSIKNKVSQLAASLDLHRPDIVIGTETWLNPSVLNSEIFPPNYTMIRKDRKDSHGGVLIALKNDLIGTHRVDFDSECETVWVQVQLTGSKTLTIGAFYRPPDQKSPQYLGELRKSLSKLKNSHKGNVWLAGDFNMGDIDWGNQTVQAGSPYKSICHQMIDLANEYNLSQLVTEPTRKDSILDLFFTNNPTLVEKSSLLPGMSDHDGIPILIINTRPKLCKTKPRKSYQFKNANMEELKKELGEYAKSFTTKNSHLETVNNLWNQFRTKLLTLMDKHIPHKMVRSCNKSPWINAKVKRHLRRKQRAYNRARKSNKEVDWAAFKSIGKNTHRMTRHTHRRYIRNFCLESKKQFWSFVKSQKRDSTGIPALKDQGILISDNAKKAKLLNQQFHSVFTQEDMSSIPNMTKGHLPTMPGFKIHQTGVQKLLANLKPNKATGPDDIPPRILKETAEEITPILTLIFQRSIDTGSLPTDWKKANVSPIYKKGDRTKASNYRPVSLTSVCCKILEHIVHSQIMSHFDKYNIITPQQHGFRKGHSCETQLIQTMYDLTTSSNKKVQTDAIILDFSKAFDTVPHNRLILKLSHMGINTQMITWITAFLKDRRQRVVVGGEHSDWVGVESGVPQGTVLGPLLFLAYINDLPDELQSTARLFADDCIIYTSVKSANDSLKLQNDLNKLTLWEKKWQMSFNAKKCFLLRIPCSKSPIITQYTLGNSILQEVTSHTYLGVDIQQDLKWDTHINRVTTTANKTLGFIRRNLYSCTRDTKSNAYTALVRPTLEYCSSVWDPHTKEHIQKVGKIQRRAARMVFNDYDWENKTSVTKLMKDLNWGMLSTRRKIARIQIMHKAIGGHLALPVHKYLQPAQRRTRQSHSNSFITYQSSKDCHKYSFVPQTIRDWNLLPQNITDITTPDTLKTNLVKHYLTKDQAIKDIITNACIAQHFLLGKFHSWNVKQYT